jgi:prolyl 4-hydroxylase
MMRMIQGGHNNRLATVFWYMSNVNGGGETSFPFSASPLGKRPHRGNPGDDRCGEFGLAVKPEKGKVIVFYSLQPDGSGDETSLHAACKPTDEAEVKWSGNKWLWNTPQRHIQ